MKGKKKREIASFENTMGLLAMTPIIYVIASVSKESQGLCTLLNKFVMRR